jgi:hypothetical protein
MMKVFTRPTSASDFFGMKLENRLKHGAIMWFFESGSEFRAHLHDWIIDS